MKYFEFANCLPPKPTCYFCQGDDGHVQAGMHFYCTTCVENTGLMSVITTWEAGELLYAHIHTTKTGARLYLRENFTQIWGQLHMRTSGFPFNPDNIKEKIKLYLTFS
jgi:hypothetical protein